MTPAAAADRALQWFPTPLPPDVDPGQVQRFLAGYADVPFLWLALSGAHAFGFPSPDSDLDLKAIHAVPAERVLGLSPAVAPIEVIVDFEGREMDLSSHDLGQAIALLLKGNGNMIERLLGPLPVVVTEAGRRLQQLAQASLNARAQHHYKGFFHRMRQEYVTEKGRGVRKAKRLLYGYRAALTGIHLLKTGAVVTDVTVLAREHGFPRVDELLRIKQGAEKQTLADAADDAPYLADHAELEARLDAAAAGSVLPAAPPNTAALEAFLVEQRLLTAGAAPARDRG